MKKIILLLSAWIALSAINNLSVAQSSEQLIDTIYLGPGYINEVYYSMSKGQQGAVSRKQWDIAFRASRMSASILTNDAANNTAMQIQGVELYTYENADTLGWLSFDTTGLSTWKLLVNSTTDWEEGAFCRNQKGHPDYGWGKYNTVTHDVVGDSLYVVKLRDGSYRKLWIKRKYSSDNKYEFRYANLDGSGDQRILLDCEPYASKNFVGYSFATNEIVDFEPVPSKEWDLLFTRYIYTYPDGVIYPVTGVLSNYGIKVNKFEHVSPDYRLFDLESMDSTRSAIGWEWKYLDGSFVFHVVDSLVHFVQDKSGSIYRLVFKEFAGSSTGKIVLEKEMISLAGVDENAYPSFQCVVYPNPASTNASLLINPGKNSSVTVSIIGLSGKLLQEDQFRVIPDNLNQIPLPVNELSSGIYLFNVISGFQRAVLKLIVQR